MISFKYHDCLSGQTLGIPAVFIHHQSQQGAAPVCGDGAMLGAPQW